MDDTGGKCALETCARKLNRKVSGSFKAIVGSAVKFGLLTSKREMLTTTTLFRRIKHAYDKQEELLFHREAFLTPVLFTQLCRKFRSRELPVAMLDVLLMREFGVEEINAQGVAKAFVDGAHMVGLLDEHNMLADIDQLAAQQGPRRELASPPLAANVFRQVPAAAVPLADEPTAIETTESAAPVAAAEASERISQAAPTKDSAVKEQRSPQTEITGHQRPVPVSRPAPAATADAIANLFGLSDAHSVSPPAPASAKLPPQPSAAPVNSTPTTAATISLKPSSQSGSSPLLFRIDLSGPGINTQLDVTEAEDLALIRALLDKIERQLRR
ncbi:hypothetical protein [Hymenobacter cheonanensis]|uniref:hypothetical protein n=1 Tax=Hymenobacter sp. CA2-7 TaxID=3063993 RepID=UPI002712A943|nr:hypothetical protein [Hymenobacter sp. CA2-7]MDO7886306.1 hypothetical protein [Hymenobacter sp. CA2-7]